MSKLFNPHRLTITGIAIIAAATAAPVSATGADGPRIARTAQPNVKVAPSSVAPGDALTITGRNWPARRAVRLYLGRPLGEDTVLNPVALVKTNGRGGFRKTLWVAPDAPAGSYSIEACRRECEVSASADFRVSAPVPPAPPAG